MGDYWSKGVVSILHENISSDLLFSTDDGTSGEAGEEGAKVSVPKASVLGGTYHILQTIKLSSDTVGSQIYYTTDGSAPSKTNGMIYKGNIIISSATTLKAVAIKEGMYDSDIMTEQYIISLNESGEDSGNYTLSQGKKASIYLCVCPKWCIQKGKSNSKIKE